MKELKDWKPNKEAMVDDLGRSLTQMLFLELGYNYDKAIYSLKEYHHTADGVLYPSLKLLYLQEEDVTEYEFANRYLLGWKHWQRICANKALAPHVEEWRVELELKIRAQAIRDVMGQCAAGQGGFQAARWLADRGWAKRPAGRPSKEDIARHTKVDELLKDEFENDSARMGEVRRL